MVHAELQVTERTPSHPSLWGIKRAVVGYQTKDILKWLKEFCDQTVKTIVFLLLFSYCVCLYFVLCHTSTSL